MNVDVLAAKAGDAFKAGNYKTAFDLMSHCLVASPNDGNLFDLFYAMAARRVPGVAERILGPIPSLVTGQALGMLGKPVSAMQSLHKALWSGPGNPLILRQFAKAAMEAGNHETAIVALQKAHALQPRNVGTLRALGEACWKGKKFKAAQKCFYDIQRMRPTDQEATRALHDLAADATIDEGRYEEKGDFRRSVKDLEGQKRLHDEKRSVVTDEDAERAIKDVEANILTNPDKLLNYLKLAELQRRRRAWDKAEEALKQGLAIAPQNAQILAALGELAVVRLQGQIEEIRQELAASPDDEKLKGDLARLEREALDFEIEEVEKVLRVSPLSGETRMRLGELYLRAGRLDDAVATFQKCVNDPRRRLRALLRLGQAFSSKGMHDLAARQCETVVNETEVMNDLKKEATYELARALEASGSLAEALARYQAVYEVDIGYRDVASRVETLYNQTKDSP